jgi:hypothetical protein
VIGAKGGSRQLGANVFYQFPTSNINERQDFDRSPRVVVATIPHT